MSGPLIPKLLTLAEVEIFAHVVRNSIAFKDPAVAQWNERAIATLRNGAVDRPRPTHDRQALEAEARSMAKFLIDQAR